MASAIVLTRPIDSGPDVLGLSTTIINGQPMLTLADITRSNKALSVSEQVFVFSSKRVSHLDWLVPADVADADSGYVADFDGTITSITAHCENTNESEIEIQAYIETAATESLLQLSGGENVRQGNTALDIDFSQGERIRLRAVGVAGEFIEDTIIKVTIKWRG